MTSTTSTQTRTETEPTGLLSLRGSAPRPIDEIAREASKETSYKYARYLPSKEGDGIHYPPLTDFEHVDPGLEALKHENPQEFLESATVTALTPKFGSEIEGIQLTQLGTRGRQQLAKFVAERGVVVFREQEDFIDQDPDWLLHDWGSFFGRLHIHPVSAAPKGYPEFHLIYRDGKGSLNNSRQSEAEERLSTTAWHSDVTYEKQPPGLTALFLFESPESGGDTAYVSLVEAYKRLSPSFRGYLETLSAVHSGVAQADSARQGSSGGIIRRDPVENVHPVVRQHPVTGQKALFVNQGFTRRIVGLKTEESDALLNLLFDHIAKGIDFQLRAVWKPRTVVLWDNRVTAHSAISDFDPTKDGRRHGTRITSQAERPVLPK